MKIKSIVVSLLISSLAMVFPLKSGAWVATDHTILASKGEQCVSLPKPPQKRCAQPVDDIFFKVLLWKGSMEPDITDGLSSPKHAFNPKYEANKDVWNPEIKATLGMPNAQINAGTAIETIGIEINKTKNLLKLNCNSGLSEYGQLWRQFGRLSHYPADLAVPMHTYSVGIDNKYHEGDIGSDGKWFKGLWDLPGGRALHGLFEVDMSIGLLGSSGCSSLPPTDVAQRARAAMMGYNSVVGDKMGYEGLVNDFLLANQAFFIGIGRQQGRDALGGIVNVWREALSGFTPPTNCEERLPDSCEDSRTYPGGDYPDDSFSVSTLSPPPSLEELLEQSWDRLAMKKQKKSLIWYWMQEYLLKEYYLGNIDEETYKRLSGSFGLTSEVASELFYEDYITTPDVAILGRGFALSMSDLFQNKFYEPIRRLTVDDFSPDARKDYPILVIPSGGLMGLENSEVFKMKLDEYVKQGGTLIVFAQQHGYEFSALPVPQEEDGSYRTIGGYGWAEDQSCFVNAVYIETWHQMFAGQNKSTPNLHLDGYFTTYPSNASVLLRRTANGQPALLMYEYGQGQVIITSMYSDFALKQKQASSEEIALVRDIISWAKKPDELPEVKPGETVSVSMEVKNITTNDAVSIKFLIYNPNRSILLSEQIVSISIPTGQSAIIPITYTTTPTSALGIYHIDYTLMDVHGNIIQTQAETDSGRFVVSNPPTNEYKPQDLLYSINTPGEQFLLGQPVPFTVTIWNNSNYDKKLRLYWDLSHLTASFLDEVTVAAHGTLSKNYNVNIPKYGASVRLWMHFFEENGTAVRKQTFVNVYGEIWPYVGSCSKGITIVHPSVDAAVKTDKPIYAKGEMVVISASFRNRINTPWQTIAKITITDPKNTVAFEDSRAVVLSPNETASFNSNYTLPQTSLIGTYTVKLEALYQGDIGLVLSASTRFELPQSQISVSPNLPSVFNMGTNTIPFTISNTGKINVSSGTIDLSLKAPDGGIVYSGSQPFSIAVGESKTLDTPIFIPSLKLGNYVLAYSQSDETRTGSPTNITILNSIGLSISFDKPTYRVRETANLKVDLRNIGKFNQENVSVSASVPDAGYSETKTISLLPNQNSQVSFSILLPDTVTSGQHNVDVTVTLPSGSGFTKSTTLIVPESALVTDYSGNTTLRVGDSINITIENKGGLDTTFTTEKMSIKDRKGVEIYSASVNGTVLAGEKKSLIDIQIPPQTMNGRVFLNIQIKDNKTGKRIYFFQPFEVNGLSATLQTRTDKDSYLKTEGITGLSNITNGSFGIESASLNIFVSRVSRRFSYFLPKEDWAVFYQPSGIAVGPDDSIYVADTWNDRIQKFDKDWNLTAKWGSWGWRDGEFQRPTGIAIGPDGSVYVTDIKNHRIQKFDPYGNFIAKWGREGSGSGEFYYPSGIAVGADGSVYVVDTGNYRIQKFQGDGTFLAEWGYGFGFEYEYFSYPQGIAVSSDGLVYFVDTWNSQIQIFDSNGNFLEKWGGFGWEEGKYHFPSGIAIGPDGSVYVTDTSTENHRIQKFDVKGTFITKWEWESKGMGWSIYHTGIAVGPDGLVYVADPEHNRVRKFDENGNFIAKWGNYGSEDDQFDAPYDISLGSDGSIYVADTWNSRILKFHPNGNLITKFGHYGSEEVWLYRPYGVAVGPDDSVYVADTENDRIVKFDREGNFITQWGGIGWGDGKFYMPYDLAVGPDGSVYVTDSGNDRIQKFDDNGNFVTKWGSWGSGNGQFGTPRGIAIGPDGSVYVGDNYHRIQKFDSQGTFITSWGSYGSGDGQFFYPSGIAVALNGSVYVVDSYNDRIQRFDGSGNFIDKIGVFGEGEGYFNNPEGIAIGPDGFIYVTEIGNHRIQRMTIGGTPEAIEQMVFHTAIPINQSANMAKDYTTDIGILNTAGKYYLKAILINSLGQTLSQASYPFHVFEEDMILLLNTDKKVYRPGETVTVTGWIENRASIEAVGLVFSLSSKLINQNPQLLFTETYNIPAGGTRPFTITTTAGAEGTATLIGKVSQNNSTLVEIMDQYEVARPIVSVSVLAPDIVGNEPFSISVEIKNTGKVEAAVQFAAQSADFGDSQTITVLPGETRLIQYQQQIHQATAYTFTFLGDLDQSFTRTVSYGLGASIQFGVGGSELGVFPEGSVAVPITVTNTGQLAETLEINFNLTPGDVKQNKTYYLATGTSIADTLYFNLTEGDYQITASSQKPDATDQASFSVRKENQVEMAVTLGTQTDGLIPVNVNLTNLGYNEISGSVNVSVSPSTGQAVWNGGEPISQLLPQSSQLITLNINPSAIEPGNYNLQVQLLNNSNQVIEVRSSEFGVRSATFQITQLPPYQTFMAGQEATFVLRVKNTGNQEGSFDLRLKSYDLIDSTQREWLKPGEEKAVTFSFMLPEDLEEKDYFANYELNAQSSMAKGQIKYYLAGISLNINASLDKPYYSEGEAAHLTINIQTSNPNPQNLFARVNYAGFEPQQTFTLNGSQVLIFDVPLPQITREKLFYGIYHESGRSIHLNSLYIHKAGEVITITTHKQVYNPGEVVSVSVSGNASGNMTLSCPGGYTETFTFSNQANKSFVLPSTLTAGTYFINVQLVTPNSELITTNYPFDVAGIQVKVLECHNDKGKHAATDTIITTLTISSNTAMPAILKAWIVDPTGQYTSVGEQSISLSSSENSLITYQSLLATSVSGIHRLVYGVYAPGSGDPGLPGGELLLVSGSEAFDVGDAVLLGLSTNKRDYPTNTEPVIVTASLFGSVNANLDLELDGIAIKSESISLNGFMTYTTELQNITPGPHTLKATLTAGGLKSTKETSFTYALSLMPKPEISALPASHDFGNVNFGSTSTKTITLSSTGNANLVIGMVALSGTNQGEFTIQNDGCSDNTITPSGTCTLDILFSPTSLGAKSASLSIPSNATTTPTLFLPLSGIGVTILNLNISINPMGGGRVTGTGIDCPGDCTESFSTSGAAIQLTATPTEGYGFVNWTGDINQTDNPVTVNMDTNKNVTANFIISAYTIHAIAGSGGTISPSGSVTVNHGGSQTFTITPDAGYRVAEVKVDGVSVGAVLTYTFSNLTSDRTIEVIFAVNQYTITATAGLNGTITPSGSITVNHGASQTFTIMPSAGYHVADVKVDGASVGAATTFTFNNVTSNHTIEVTFAIDNRPPVADAGPDRNVITGQVVTLNGSNSYDPEGAMITFLWTFVEVPAGSSVTDASLSDVTSAKPQFTPDVSGAYRFQLIVNDGALDSVPDEALIHATTPNVPPNADAGPDRNVFTGNIVQLDGSRSSDPDNGPLPLSYLWSFLAKPAGSLLTDHHIVNRNMPNATFVPDVNGLYELMLTVSDGNLSSEDTVQIMATISNVPPNANAGADRTIYLGDAAALDGSASNDLDHGPQPLAYLWSFVAVPTGSRLTNGAISGANTVSPSFTPDAEGTYVLQLMVFDGRDAGFDNVAVTVLVDNTAPTLAPVPNEAILWPPNHKMVNITIWANASDNAGHPVALSAVVSSNEPQDGLGDGDTSPDWTEPVIDQINGIITLKLRSERSGRGNGRIYTITITARDASGNRSQANVEIRVPHSR